MANYNYFLTFRIANKVVGGKTYDERRQRLIDNVYVEGGPYWDETTSFIIVGSDLKTPAFAEQASKGLSAADDLVVAFDPSDMSAAYFGTLKHKDVLGSFFKSLKKVD